MLSHLIKGTWAPSTYGNYNLEPILHGYQGMTVYT
jgi:hypothetical protein